MGVAPLPLWCKLGGMDSSAHSYSRDLVDEVWLLAEPIEGNDDALWRRDECGNRIQRHEYGKHGSAFGWGIAPDGPGRLKPLHWSSLESGGSSSAQALDGLFSDTLELF